MTTPTPELTEAERRRGQQSAVRANAFTQSITDVVTGNVMQLFAVDVLSLSSAQIGLLRGLPPLAALVRMAVLPLTRRLGLVGTLRWSAYLRLAVVAVLIALPLKFISFPVYLGLLIVFSLAWNLGPRVAWQPLMRQISTGEDRGQFFSRMRFTFSITGAGTSLLTAFLIGDQLSIGTYTILLVLVFGMLIYHLIYVARIPETRNLINTDHARPSMLSVLRQSPLLRRPLAIDVLLLAANFPLMLVYLRQILHLPSNIVAGYMVFVAIGTTLSLLLWGRIADALGFKPVLVGLLTISILAGPIILAAPPLSDAVLQLSTLSGDGWRTLAVIAAHALIMGTTAAGIGIATISVQHHFVQAHDALEAMSWHATVLILAEAGIAVLAGWILAGPALSWPGVTWLDGLIHVDAVKIWLVGVGGACKCIALGLAMGLPNARPEFGVGDFFTSMAANPLRTLVASRLRHDEAEMERARVARWFGDHVSPMGLAPLLDLLGDPSFDVRVEAVRSLARTQSRAAGDRLEQALQHPEYAAIADQLVWALGELRHHASVPTLIRILATPHDERLRGNAARALGKIGDQLAIPAIVARLEHGDETVHVRAAAARALLRLRAQDYIPLVVAQLPLLHDRIERHELYDVLCDWMGITNRWLLRSKGDLPLRTRLAHYVSERPAAWLRQHQPIIEALTERNAPIIYAAIDRELSADSAVNDPVLMALRHLDADQQRYGQHVTLLTAWLFLHHDQPRNSAT